MLYILDKIKKNVDFKNKYLKNIIRKKYFMQVKK